MHLSLPNTNVKYLSVLTYCIVMPRCSPQNSSDMTSLLSDTMMLYDYTVLSDFQTTFAYIISCPTTP